MSLDIRTTYLNWIIGTSLGIALWYRNTGVDRPLGGFLIAISLVFLIEYGIANVMDPDIAVRFILAIFGLSIFILAILTSCNYRASYFNDLIMIIAVIFMLWMFYIASMDVNYHSNLCEWLQGENFAFGISFVCADDTKATKNKSKPVNPE